jgi:hypothetical protein
MIANIAPGVVSAGMQESAGSVPTLVFRSFG